MDLLKSKLTIERGLSSWGRCLLVLLAALLVVLAGCAGGDIDEIPPANQTGPGNGGGLDTGPGNGGSSDGGGLDAGSDDASGDSGGEDAITGPVDCTDDSECAPLDQVCDRYDKICVDPCEDNAECAPGVCDSFYGHCLACENNSHCPDGVCDSSGDDPICRDCLASLDCDGALVCLDHQCVECRNNNDCPGPFTPFCNQEENLCVRCVDNTQCPGGNICVDEGARCVECEEDTDCPDSFECDQEAGRCTGCTDDGDCEDSFCRTSDSVCVECLDDDQCPGGFCEADGQYICQECLENQDCPTGEVCVTEYDLDLFRFVNFCADCETDAHCDWKYDDRPTCTSNYVCV